MSKNWPENEANWAKPGAQGENLKVNEFLTAHLIRLASISKTCVTREYLEPAGLSLPEWRLLATLVVLSPVAFSDVVAKSTMDKGQISRTLRSAQLKGLVATEVAPAERRPGDSKPVSGGRIVVSVTPAGREVYERVIPVAQRYQHQLLELMDPEERRVVLGVLQRLYRHMGAD